MRIAVIGNTPVNGGVAVAADLALAGHDITFAPWPGEEAILAPIAARGGIELAGEVGLAIAGRGGLAQVDLTTSLADAVNYVELVVLDVPAPDFEKRFEELLPHLAQGQLVHINMHGYWPALRLAPLLIDAGRQDITISETMAPSHAAAYADGLVDLQWVRGKIPTAVFPASRTDRAMETLQGAFPMLRRATNVLETGFAGLNMMIHFPLVLVNIGWCDRLEEEGSPVPLYLDGMTRHASNLVEAQDSERRLMCDAFGVAFKSLPHYLGDLYGASGDNAFDAVSTSKYYRELPPYPASAWQRWMTWDIPHAHLPAVSLAELAGIDVPLHRAAVSLCSAFLKTDFATGGITLKQMRLDRLSVAQVNEYANTGRLPQ